jgi:hypothetical protein
VQAKVHLLSGLVHQDFTLGDVAERIPTHALAFIDNHQNQQRGGQVNRDVKNDWLGYREFYRVRQKVIDDLLQPYFVELTLLRHLVINFEVKLQVAQIGKKPLAINCLLEDLANVEEMQRGFELIFLD